MPFYSSNAINWQEAIAPQSACNLRTILLNQSILQLLNVITVEKSAVMHMLFHTSTAGRHQNRISFFIFFRWKIQNLYLVKFHVDLKDLSFPTSLGLYLRVWETSEPHFRGYSTSEGMWPNYSVCPISERSCHFCQYGVEVPSCETWTGLYKHWRSCLQWNSHSPFLPSPQRTTECGIYKYFKLNPFTNSPLLGTFQVNPK